ncbi:hypothetical protein FGO68_gene10835 [Halteria grandinella]|uniref:Uncharacterized protein n=1 Tax=Halteria grandinella TaxID=5974 RepID=A0A8J8P949_HALGN|nr:hypothetical protein FGO68_gene10835 [Halteria grandinella]
MEGICLSQGAYYVSKSLVPFLQASRTSSDFYHHSLSHLHFNNRLLLAPACLTLPLSYLQHIPDSAANAAFIPTFQPFITSVYFLSNSAGGQIVIPSTYSRQYYIFTNQGYHLGERGAATGSCLRGNAARRCWKGRG